MKSILCLLALPGATSLATGSDLTLTYPKPPASRAFYSVLTATP